MPAEDAGSIYSEVRIRLDKLQNDITQAVSVMDRFGQKVVDTGNIASNLFSNSYGKSIKQVESYVKSLDKAVTDGALTQREAIKTALEARKAELAYIQATAAKKGGFTDQEINDLKRVKTQIASLTEEQKKLGKETEKATANFKAMGLAAVAASTLIISSFRSLITSTAQYGQALSDVQAATRGTAEDLAKLESAAASAGDELATSTTDALGAVEALAKAGVSTADIMGGALPGALTLAAAGSMDVADAAEIAAATMTQFGLGGEDVVHIADLLAAGAGKAQGEVSDLSMALKQAGLVASQTGLSVDDTVGALAAFASAGLLGSDAGTSFRTMLLRLTPQSKEAADEMERLGLNAFDAKGEFIGITAFAGQLKTQLKDLTTEQRNSALATIFGSDSIRAANVLYTQGAEGLAEWISKVNDQGFAAETARIKLDNLNGDLKKFSAATTDTTNKIGTGLTPTIRGITQFLTGLIDVVGKIPTWFTSFAVSAGVVAASLVGLNAGLGLLGITLGALTGPIGAIVIGLSAVTGGIVAATGAVNDAKKADASKEFGDIAVASRLAGDELAKFPQRASDAEQFLRALSAEGRTGGSAFEQLAKDMGLTNDQLAQIALRSKTASDAVKETARKYLDGEAAAKRFAEKNAALGLTLRDAWRKGTPEEIKKIEEEYRNLMTASDGVGDANKELAKAQAKTVREFQVGNERVKLGLDTELERLNTIIGAREGEIDALLGVKAENGKLSTEEQKRLENLIKWNKEDAESVRVITQEVIDWKAAETDAYQNAQGIATARKQLQDDILANATEDTLSLIDLETLTVEQLTLLNERLALAKEKTRNKELEDNLKLANATLDAFSSLASALGDIFASIYQRQIDEATLAYDKERELIENNGLTKKQVLEQNLVDAQTTGDAQATADAQRALDLYNLEADFEKKKAQLQYEAALSSWKIQLAMTTAQAFQAALNAYSSTALVPLVGPALAGPVAAGVMGGIGALSIAAVAAAMPQPPKFETGGIVLGNSTTGDKIPALVNSREMILTQEQQAQLFAMANGAGGGGSREIVIPIKLVMADGKVITEMVVKHIDGGQVKAGFAKK